MASVGSRLVGRMVALLEIAFSPESVAVRTRGSYSWLVPWVVVSAGTAILSYYTTGYSELFLRLANPEVAVPGSNAAQMLQEMREWSVWALASTPMMLLLQWGFKTLLLLALCRVVGLTVSASTIFTLVAYCSGIVLLGELFGFVILSFSAAPQTVADLVPKVGLNAFIQFDSVRLQRVVNWFSLPSLLYYVVLAEGLSAFSGIKSWQPTAVVVIYATGSFLYSVIFAMLAPL